MKKILYFVQMPPPYHGVSTLNKVLFESTIVNSNVEKVLLPINFSKSHKDLNKVSFSKLISMFVLAFKLLWTLIVKKIDCVYFTITPSGTGFFRDFVFVLIMKLCRVKIIYHLHGVGIKNSLAKKPNLKRLYSFVFREETVIHLSKGLLESEIKANFTNIQFNSFVLNNGISSLSLKSKSDSLLTPRILFLSNLFPSKGIFDALLVFKELKNDYPDLILDIAGASSGSDVDEEINQILREYNIKDNVFLHGFVDGESKQKLLKNACLLLHPTYNDAFPLVLLEAMMHGKPVISTTVGAIPELVLDQKTGFLLKSGDIDGIAQKIRMLLNDKELYDHLSFNSTKVFYESYTLDIFERNFRTILNKVL